MRRPPRVFVLVLMIALAATACGSGGHQSNVSNVRASVPNVPASAEPSAPAYWSSDLDNPDAIRYGSTPGLGAAEYLKNLRPVQRALGDLDSNMVGLGTRVCQALTARPTADAAIPVLKHAGFDLNSTDLDVSDNQLGAAAVTVEAVWDLCPDKIGVLGLDAPADVQVRQVDDCPTARELHLTFRVVKVDANPYPPPEALDETVELSAHNPRKYTVHVQADFISSLEAHMPGESAGMFEFNVKPHQTVTKTQEVEEPTPNIRLQQWLVRPVPANDTNCLVRHAFVRRK